MTADSEAALVSESGEIRVEVVEESPVVKTLTVEVAAPRVAKAFDKAYEGLRKQARIKGFRPGKAPRAVLERLYGASVPDEIERALVGETLADAVELSQLTPLMEPGIEAERPEPGQAFRYKARIECKPEIELPELEALPAKRPAVSVGDDEVLTRLEALRERTAPILEEPEGTAAELGHYLTIDYVGRLEGEPFEGGSGEDTEVELGAGRLVPGFEDQLVGAVAGEDRELEITFPDDYAHEELRGKVATFAAHVSAVKRREQRELDDEFAKDMGDFENLGELRERIRSDLLEERERIAKAALRRSVMDALIERTDFEVSPGVVEQQLRQQLASMQREYAEQVPEDVLHNQLARMAEEGRPAAERRMREAFLLAAVARDQGIEVADEDVDARLDELAEARGTSPSELRKLARDQGWRDAIRAELLDERALDFLTAGAKVEEVTDSEGS